LHDGGITPTVGSDLYGRGKTLIVGSDLYCGDKTSTAGSDLEDKVMGDLHIAEGTMVT